MDCTKGEVMVEVNRNSFTLDIYVLIGLYPLFLVYKLLDTFWGYIAYFYPGSNIPGSVEQIFQITAIISHAFNLIIIEWKRYGTPVLHVIRQFLLQSTRYFPSINVCISFAVSDLTLDNQRIRHKKYYKRK